MNSRDFLYKTAQELADLLAQIDYDSLPISDYNKGYIDRMKKNISYYMEIYAYCIHLAVPDEKQVEQQVWVDYGGGHGFFSLLAKKMGVKQVIYLDMNSESAHTAEVLKAHLGYGPDIVLCGNSTTLITWCQQHHEKPNMLFAMDVIEHIYNLESYFADLMLLNSSLRMFFTTASTPYNPWVKNRLHKWMHADEKGSRENPNFYTLRMQFIQLKYPNFSNEMISYWAANTRGLIYEDIETAIESHIPNDSIDAYNTCDPRTGNWTERILPIAEYERLVQHYGYKVSVKNGFYNIHRFGLKKYVCYFFNLLINHGIGGRFIAPFIVLQCEKRINDI